MDESKNLRYPIGKFEAPDPVCGEDVARWIDEIEAFPSRLRAQVARMSPAQLDTRYRPGGWTARQVVHHLADSHMNSFVRFKLALTEDHPTIKPYYEDRWAELPDARETPIEASLDLIEALHARWTILLRSLGPQQLERGFDHPESGDIKLAVNIGIYAWHGRHHLAHMELIQPKSV